MLLSLLNALPTIFAAAVLIGISYVVGRVVARLVVELLKSIGHWPMGSQLIPVAPARSVDRSLDSFRLLGPDRFLIDSVELPSGGRLEIAFPLKAYADDAGVG